MHSNDTKEKLDERTYYPRLLLVYTVMDVQVHRNDTTEIMTREHMSWNCVKVYVSICTVIDVYKCTAMITRAEDRTTS